MKPHLTLAALVGVGIAAPAEAEMAADPIIIVSGQRQEAELGSKAGADPADIPAAVVVVPREVIEQQDVRTLDDALRNASAVAPVFGGGYGLADNYAVRGLPTRFLRDGLPDGPTFVGYRRTLADVAAIEVLKGPGSALYGSSEAGGTVNISTLQPQPVFAARVEGSIGALGTRALTGDVTGPLTDGLSARLIANHEERDGYRGLASRTIDLLPSVAARVGDHRLSLDYDRRDQRLVVDNYGIPFTVARTLAPIDRQSRLYSPFNRVEQRIDRVTLRDEVEAAPDLLLRAALAYDHRQIDLTRNAGSTVVNAAGVIGGRNGRTQRDNADYWLAQLEAVATLRTGSLAHKLLLGTEYSDSAIRTVRRNYALPDIVVANGAAMAPETSVPTATTLAFDRSIRSRTLSLYGQEQAEIGEHLKLRLGARLDGVRLTDEGLQGARYRRIAGSPDLFSWQAGAVYQPSRTLSFYAGYSRGQFVSVQTESTALSAVPESSEQIELGAKARLVDGRLSANLALFDTRRQDYFVTLVPGGDPVQVGRQRSRGVELDVIGQPLPGLSVIGNIAYVDARNRSAALAGVGLIAANRPVLGYRLNATPEWSGSIWAAYEVPGGALQGLSVGAGVTYKDAVYVDQLELLRVPAYAVARAAIGYRLGPVEAQLTLDNLFDARYFRVPTFIGALPGDPRSLKLTLRTRL